MTGRGSSGKEPQGRYIVGANELDRGMSGRAPARPHEEAVMARRSSVGEETLFVAIMYDAVRLEDAGR